MNDWEEIARLEKGKAHLERICWPYDAYPEMQQLTAGASIVLLDADGPGVVTNIHSSKMDYLDDVLGSVSAREPDAYQKVRISVTYDDHPTPDIEMPLCDFLADADGNCDFFRTLYFSKVHFSHNFRLPMPFKKHIKIIISNPSETDLIGYTDLQWKKVDRLPDDVGYLKVWYEQKTVRVPEEKAILCDIREGGTLRAHWLSIGSSCPFAADGEYVCEGNQLFYVDGETDPSLEYLGTEDVYSHSWGFQGTGGDGYAAITQMVHQPKDRTVIAMLRCRTIDSIPFEKSLRVVLDYEQEYFSASSRNPLHRMGVFANRIRTIFDEDLKSCWYYYAKSE